MNQTDKAMKRFLILAIMAILPLAADAQECKGKNEWKERMLQEKIAFLSTEVGFTTEEAQAFWPVYNKAEENMDQARHRIMSAYRTLSNGFQSGAGNREIETMFNAYLAALEEESSLRASLAEEYGRVLPKVKVAKLFVAEEKFRRQQIHKLHNPGPKKQ